MIIDVIGIELTPGNHGLNCMGNGEYVDEKGNIIECCCDECDYFLCCCDECDYFLCCFDGDYPLICTRCTDLNCPRNILL